MARGGNGAVSAVSAVSAVPVGCGIDVGVEFGRLREAVVGFHARAVRAVSPVEIGEQVIHLSQTIDMLNRDGGQLVGLFVQTGEAERQGSNSDVDWVRHQCRMSATDASELVVVGEHLAELSQSSAALDEGKVGFGHLVHMARNARFSSRSGRFDEVPLLAAAREESVSRFRHTCLSVRHAQDPEGFVEAEVNAVESRELFFYPQDDGMTLLSARLDSLGAATVETALAGLGRRLGPDDHRTRARRDADSMVEMATYIMNNGGVANRGSQRTHLTVTCTLESLMGLPGAPGAEVEHGQPISAEAVARFACDASITKILLDDRLVPLAVGRETRVVSPAERRVLNTRDKGCRWPGCSRTASQCDAHHVVFFSRGGPTRLQNMILLCPSHHWRVHEGGWKLMLTDDLQVVVVPPSFQLARGPTPAVAA